MKKICLILSVMFLSKAAFSQINIGIKAGGNISTTKNLIAFPKNKVGWYGGVSGYIPIHKRLFFCPEILYSSKGHRVDQIVGGYTSERLSYLNMPILLSYNFDKRTSILFGPEFGYLLSDILVLNGGSTTISGIKQFPPKFDVAVCTGLQYKMINNIKIEIRYNYGFNTLYHVDVVGNRYSEKKGANRVFQFGINYLFRKQKTFTK